MTKTTDQIIPLKIKIIMKYKIIIIMLNCIKKEKNIYVLSKWAMFPRTINKEKKIIIISKSLKCMFNGVPSFKKDFTPVISGNRSLAIVTQRLISRFTYSSWRSSLLVGLVHLNDFSGNPAGSLALMSDVTSNW